MQFYILDTHLVNAVDAFNIVKLVCSQTQTKYVACALMVVDIRNSSCSTLTLKDFICYLRKYEFMYDTYFGALYVTHFEN